jgi:23S rRNA (guanine745-N1)-methyltransferase
MNAPSRVHLVCSVRGCGRELAAGEASYSCLAGHAFDLARSGYLNLLQVQDRRSNEPGDSSEVVAARRRWMKSGRAAPLGEALLAEARALGIGSDSRVLDVGCGEGSFLGEIQAATGCEAWGVDISRAAAEAAARRWPAARWVVCNADLGLPFAPASFELVLSITSRRNAAEFARVLAPGGALFFAVPAEDDQRELRELLHGEAFEIDRLPGLESDLAAGFVLERSRRLSWTNRLDREGFGDLLALAYRGARERERARLEQRAAVEVTSSYRLALFRRRAGA